MTREDRQLERMDGVRVLDVQDYAHSIWTSKYLILFLAGLGLAAAVVWLKFFPAEYKSKAVIRFIPPKVSERYVSTSGDSWAEQRTATLSQSLSSSLTARKMIDGAKLYPELRRFMTTSDLVPRFQSALSVHSVAWKGAPGARPVASIEIEFKYSNPEMAKRVVQQMIETIYETNERYRGDQSLGTSQFLTEQTDAVRMRLEEMEESLGALSRPDRIAGDHQWALKIQNLHSVENRLGHVQSSLRSARKHLTDTLSDVTAVEQEIRRIPQVFTSTSEPLTYAAMRLKSFYNDAEVRLQMLSRHYKPTHPERMEAEKALEELRGQFEQQQEIDVEAARARTKRQLQNKLDLLRADRDADYATIAQLEAEDIKLSRSATELRAAAYSTQQEDTDFLRSNREYTALADYYRSLYRKERDAEIASEVDRQGQGEMVELLDPPIVPTSPIFPSAPVKLAIGTAGGMGIGILFGLLRVQVRPTVRTARHLEYWQGAVLLADLPNVRLLDAASEASRSKWLTKAIRVSGFLLLMILSAVLTTGCGSAQDRSKISWLNAAAAASRQGDVFRAINCYRNVIRLDKRSGEAYKGLAGALLSIGEVEEALGNLIRAAELEPNDRKVNTDLTHLLYTVYHSDPGKSRSLLMELEDQARKMIARWPVSPEGYRAMASVLCERNRPAEAVELVSKALEKTRNDPSLIVELASLKYRHGEREQAELLLRQLTGSQSKYGQAYDLLYLQLRDRGQTESAGQVLALKWKTIGDAESGIQLAAHYESVGNRDAEFAQIEQVREKLPNQASTYELIGAFWASRGEHEMARSAYETGGQKFSNQKSNFIGKLAELDVAVGNREQALSRVRTALAKAPGDPTLLSYKAALELDATGKLDDKSTQLELELLMKRMPKSAFVRFHLGRCYMKIGDLYKAGREFERCVRLDPNYAPGWLALAESAYRAGNVAISKSTLDHLLQKAPRYAGALMLKARVLHDLGNRQATKQTLEEAAEAGAPTHEVAEARARLKLSDGDFKGAILLLEDAIRKAGPESHLEIMMARAEEAMGDSRSALARLQRVIDSYPQMTEAQAALAATHFRLARYEDSAQSYQRLSIAVPSSPMYAAGYGDALAMSGKLKEALAQYTRAQGMRGATAEIWVKAAAVHKALGDLQSARAAYETAVAMDGQNPFALNNLAYLLGRSGERMEYALQLAQNAGEIMPDSFEVQDTLIYITLRMGLKQQALEILDRVAARSAPPNKAWFKSLRAQLGRGTTQEVLKRMEDTRRERRES